MFRRQIAPYALILNHSPPRHFSNKKRSQLISNLLSMPKEKPHVKVLKEARKSKMEGAVKYPAALVHFQILGNGARGAPQSLYLFTDQTRYLFNCGEGTQRLAHEHKRKLAKLEHVFITSKTWDRIGGIPGMALTIQDIGIPAISLHGPQGIERLFEATQRFAVLNNLTIKVGDVHLEADGSTYMEDHILRIDYVPILPRADEGSIVETDSSPERDDTDYYQEIKGHKRHLEIVRANQDGTKKSKLEDGKSSDEAEAARNAAICFVCKPREKKGTLILDKCIDFGVPPGPLLGKLKNGEDITLLDGRVVLAKDVKTPDFGASPFLVIDCPTEDYLESLLENHKLLSYQNPSDIEDHERFPELIIHFTPGSVLSTLKYLEWMDGFGPRSNHLIINDLCQGMGSEGVHIVQHKLHLLDPQVFPLLNETGAPYEEDFKEREQNKPEFLRKLRCQTILPSTLMAYKMRPNEGLCTNETFHLTPAAYVKEAHEMEGFSEELAKYLAEAAKLNQPSDEEYPRIIFLGTGSSIPNKTRTTSGILVEIDASTNILLDCAEGTYGQIVRLYGNEESQRVLSRLKAIYVSHLHADHHLGLIKLLQARTLAFGSLGLDHERVLLLAPKQIMFWLNMYGRYFEKIRPHFNIVTNQSLNHRNVTLDGETMSTLLSALNLKGVETCTVRHCSNAFGVALTHASGWKLTYSGDTMPSDNLVELGKGSSVLIHEATMEDELEWEAKQKMHSTTSQAIEIGRRMGAGFTLLTHFSQRYSKVPLIRGDMEANVGIAFDNMKVRLSDLPKLPLMYPALKKLFQEHIEELELKTQKLLKRREKELGFSSNQDGKEASVN